MSLVHSSINTKGETIKRKIKINTTKRSMSTRIKNISEEMSEE